MKDKIVELAFIIEEIVFTLAVMPVALILAIWDAVQSVYKRGRR